MNKINVVNAHTGYRIKKGRIQKRVQNLLLQEKQKKSVDIILVDDQYMIALNKRYKKKNHTTDVLAFNLKEEKSLAAEDDNLGDVYICLDQAQRQAQDYQVEVEDEIHRLAIHGVLHLLGYDHKSKAFAKLMKEKEEKYLKVKKE